MISFVLIGAGFVAPRHVKAIKDVGGSLVAFTDPYDSVGWIDSYFPYARYFREFERFDRFVDKYIREKRPIDYVCVASPNYIHDTHIRWGLRNNADVICEKPLVCNYHNLKGLSELESRTGHRVWAIQQLRLHKNAAEAKAKYSGSGERHKVRVSYNVPRGRWYFHSWKNDVSKSGGLETNIGVHLFDFASWVFGSATGVQPQSGCGNEFSIGRVAFENADLEYNLGVRCKLPAKRIFEIDGEQIDFTTGFEDLHTESYRKILKGEGFGIKDAAEAIRICERIRK